mgnify:CR=1 FL=1
MVIYLVCFRGIISFRFVFFVCSSPFPYPKPSPMGKVASAASRIGCWRHENQWNEINNAYVSSTPFTKVPYPPLARSPFPNGEGSETRILLPHIVSLPIEGKAAIREYHLPPKGGEAATSPLTPEPNESKVKRGCEEMRIHFFTAPFLLSYFG